MGPFGQHLFEVGGDSGYPYRLQRSNGEPFGEEGLNLVRDTISQTGVRVDMSALDVWGEHIDAVVRVRPDLGEEAKQQLGALGIRERPITPVSL